METITLDHDQYMESIETISDEATHRFAMQAETWWNRHFNWKRDGCRVLMNDDGEHLAYLFYKTDRYRDYLTVHNLFTPKIHRDNGYAYMMLEKLFLSQADNGTRRFRMSCTSEALGFYARLSLVYWGVDSIGNYHCDLPLPGSGISGIAGMVRTTSNRKLLGKNAVNIYKKVMENGEEFESKKQQRFNQDRRMLEGAYRHQALKTILQDGTLPEI